ncbi:MAG: GNAT family N-acetyltransferase [Desulfosarcinaceae bacterium]|nr:GNAT family N-acetyltransferase [Desulfosarcinaceae bacterium]
MGESLYWADNYIEKRCAPDEAIRFIKSGQRVFIGSACGQPQHLVKTLSARTNLFTGLEIVRMMSSEITPLSDIADKTQDLSLNIRQIYLGATGSPAFQKYKRFITPMNMSEVPSLFKSKKLPIDVALIQVSPPDDFGWMSMSVSVDVTMAAAQAARLVIAQVNPRMPRIMGQSFIHVNSVDVIVEQEEDLLVTSPPEPSEVATHIGNHIARLIEDGSTLQVGLDAASQATVQALSQKNDLGFHSQYLTDDIMHLYAVGVITNRRKGFNDGKLVASAAVGSRNLYEFLHDNPGVDFHPSDYVNDPFIIARHNRMVSMNVAKAVDLTGQVAAEAVASTFFAGVSGISDFVRGAKRSPGGKSILMLPAMSADGSSSNIVPMMQDQSVVVPRGDVQYVATEYGVVNLFGKSLQERAMAMISIAHPDARDGLFEAAKDAGLIGANRSLGEARRAVYPVKLEETILIDGESLIIRPAKPVDERRIQEHYYSLDKKDIFSRFFHEKSSFGHSDIEVKSQIDYIKDMTLVGVIGEAGFGRVVAVGEYLLLFDSNMAEVAFSVSKDFQGKGLGRVFLRKLAESARENGISGLVAYTSPQNKAMIGLFKTLPYKVKTSFDGESLALSCKFEHLAENGNL